MVTIKQIREIGQWGARDHMLDEAETYPYAGRVLRKVSPYFTKFFIEHNTSANQISFTSIILGITANFMFVFGNYYLVLIGCLIYQFWNIFDLIDGEIARVTGVKTLGGKYLETINEVVTECGFVVCLGIGLSKISSKNTFTFWGLTFALFICLLNYFARTRDVTQEQLGIKEEKTAITKRMSYVKRLYKKMRLFFVIVNGYLVLTFITLFELLFPIKLYYSAFGLTHNVLSTYFLIYGFIWMIRATVSSVTNYKQLMKVRNNT